MKLTHWVDKSVVEQVLNKTYIPSKKEHFIKPSGIWLSVNNSWEDWLKDNWDDWVTGKICLKARLAKDIRLVVIFSQGQFLNLFYELTGWLYPTLLDGAELFGEPNRYQKIALFHRKLKEKYDGIWVKLGVIWEHRLDVDCDYFYPWDCESICVFNRSKIKIELIR